jgi:hypothetical protein
VFPMQRENPPQAKSCWSARTFVRQGRSAERGSTKCAAPLKSIMRAYGLFLAEAKR